MNNKITQIRLVFLLLVVLILGGCGQAVEVNKQVNPEEKPTEVKQVDTSDWQVYRNEEYGFEFRYQPYWKISATDIGVNDENKYYLLDFLSFNNYDEVSSKNALPLFYIAIIDGQKDDRKVDYGELISEEEVAGRKVFVYSKEGYFGYSKTAVVDIDGRNILLLSVSQIENGEEVGTILEEILSTIKFN